MNITFHTLSKTIYFLKYNYYMGVFKKKIIIWSLKRIKVILKNFIYDEIIFIINSNYLLFIKPMRLYG